MSHDAVIYVRALQYSGVESEICQCPADWPAAERQLFGFESSWQIAQWLVTYCPVISDVRSHWLVPCAAGSTLDMYNLVAAFVTAKPWQILQATTYVIVVDVSACRGR